MEDAIGRLATGLSADIAIFDAALHPRHRAVIDAEARDVVLVLRGGRALYGDAALVTALRGAGTCDGLDVCGSPKALCTASEIGLSYAALASAIGDGAYPAFFCGTPAAEPSCVPERRQSVSGSGVYTGAITPDDSDGDGIIDADDDCPSVFDPIRPLDHGTRADADGDGVGDACDICPLNAGTSVCRSVDPDDFDADGVLDGADNCLAVSNADQADADVDDHGDACDACPLFANPGPAGCRTSIYAIKQGSQAIGDVVALGSSLVTASTPSGIFLQVSPADPGYAGPEHSGLFVFSPGHAATAGDRVSVTRATVSTFLGQTQLSAATLVVDTSLAEPPPAPVRATTGELTVGGARSGALDAVLVRVGNARVTSAPPDLAVDDGSGALPVGDQLFPLIQPISVGQRLMSLTGVLSMAASAPELEPRSSGDYLFEASGPATLASLTPSAITVPVSSSVTFSVGLSAPAPAATTIILSADPTLALVPPSVTVPLGALSTSFDYFVLAPGTATLTATLDAITLVAAVAGVESSHLVINEVDYDQVGNDTAEYVEIYNGTGAPVSLANHSLVFVNGANGASYRSINLSPAGILAAGQYLVVAAAPVVVPAGTSRLDLPAAADNLQNGAPDGIALVDVAGAVLIDALSYEGAITAASVGGIPQSVSLVEGTPLDASVADSNVATGSLCRLPNGLDSNDAANDWGLCPVLSPGEPNVF
jgi:hypothetical protein